jgi:4-hydroxybenzoate polyprenyltransferase
MATNDILDLEKDRQFAPHRPLCSGQLDRRQAWVAAALVGLGALALSAPLGAAVPALGILILAFIYNAGGKRLPAVGNALMGGCRATNLLLGATAAVGLSRAVSDRWLLLGAGLLGVYVAGITAVSVREEREHHAGIFFLTSLPLLAIPLALVILNPASPFSWLNSCALALLLGAAILAAVRRSSPPPPEAVFVRRALSGIYLVDAGLLLAFIRAPAVLWQAATLYALLALGWLWKRRWLQSGRTDT